MLNYGIITLAVASPAQTFTEPITLAEAKAHLNLAAQSPTDSAEDDLIESFITAAREVAEAAQGRELCPKQYDLALDCFPGVIELRRPLVSVDLVKYRDSTGAWTTLTADDDYIVDLTRGFVMPPYSESWPSFDAWPTSAVLVRFTSGPAADDIYWSGPGSVVRVGMLALVSHWYMHRDLDSVTDDIPRGIMRCLEMGAVPRAR